jgi:hypothetical protein
MPREQVGATVEFTISQPLLFVHNGHLLRRAPRLFLNQFVQAAIGECHCRVVPLHL